uniref:Uncharacterized protein n=1 Tax=Pyxicephalus adspersus TaxID=30357 RepID=A0AAV3B202_PYXAD|nr:TPA: hypothetical protein GDO54_007852 [Pyxicephalus adspersus]
MNAELGNESHLGSRLTPFSFASLYNLILFFHRGFTQRLPPAKGKEQFLFPPCSESLCKANPIPKAQGKLVTKKWLQHQQSIQVTGPATIPSRTELPPIMDYFRLP